MSAPRSAPTRLSSIKDAMFAPLVLIVVVLALVLWQQRAELHRLAADAPRGAPRAEIPARTARARSVLVVPPRPATPMPDELRPLDELADSGVRGFARAVPSPAARGGALERLLGNPQFFRAFALQRQAALDARFAGLFRQLALGDAELAAFKRLLADKESVALDVVAVSEAQPDGPLSSTELDAGIAAARAQIDSAIRAALGEERYAVYRDYERTLPQRALVAQLEQRLSYSPAPLAPVQAEALVRILVSHVPPAPPSAPVRPAAVVVDALSAPIVPVDVAPVPEVAIVESQAVLAPRQLAALREIQIEQEASQRAAQFLRDNLPAVGKGPGNALQQFLR
jgi:hypothetical protein